MVNFIFIIKYLNIISLVYLIDRQIYSRYGILSGIISNYNLLFINKFWSKFYNIMETKCKLLITYYFKMDGQIKRIN